MPEDVDPETVHPAPEPKAEHVVHRGAHFGVAPVEIGLISEKRVIVVLTGARIEGPGETARLAQPIVGWSSAGRGIAPDVPVALRIISRPARLLKPGMLDR